MNALAVTMHADLDSAVAHTSTVQIKAPNGDTLLVRVDSTTGGFVAEGVFVAEGGGRIALGEMRRDRETGRIQVTCEVEA